MPTDSLRWLIVPNRAVQLFSPMLPPVITIPGHREFARVGRAIAGLIIQEQQNTWTEIRAAGPRS